MRTAILLLVYTLCLLAIGIAVDAATKSALSTPRPEGALISTKVTGTAGVLLDELPVGPIRERVASALQAKPFSFWRHRAKLQVDMTSYKQVNRAYWYNDTYSGGLNPGRNSLPMPPESTWEFQFNRGPQRKTVKGHDYVLLDWVMNSVLVTDAASVSLSEPKLSKVGGFFNENYQIPVDPEGLLQRTGYACINEAQFPKGTVDSYNAWSYFDEDCEAEDPISPPYDPWLNRCHFTEFPATTCKRALNKNVGSWPLRIKWARIKYNAAIAATYRRNDPNTDDPNLAEVPGILSNSTRIAYRYFDTTSCALKEGSLGEGGCIGAPGWRRLLRFTTSHWNSGTASLLLGNVTDSLYLANNMFEWDACHNHWRFLHYGTFAWGNTTGRKAGFCIQTTSRIANNEYSPIATPFADCRYQGILPGWADDYFAGLDCQWIDVTGKAGSAKLSTYINPDGFACEGRTVTDAAGVVQFEPTPFVVENGPNAGEPVNRPRCNHTGAAFDWASDNTASVWVSIGSKGKGSSVTSPCPPDHPQLGHKRDCGFDSGSAVKYCKPGSEVKLAVSVADAKYPVALRVCEASQALNSSTHCEFVFALTTAVITSRSPATQTITFTCPQPRANDGASGGRGAFAWHTAPLVDVSIDATWAVAAATVRVL